MEPISIILIILLILVLIGGFGAPRAGVAIPGGNSLVSILAVVLLVILIVSLL